jgi:hypothetical protein
LARALLSYTEMNATSRRLGASTPVCITFTAPPPLGPPPLNAPQYLCRTPGSTG